MRYVIVSNVKGEAGEFNETMRKKVFNQFKVKSSTLPAHFTIKAPFQYEGDIAPLLQEIHTFTSNHPVTTYQMKGYNHFDDRVIYMDVDMSKEGKGVHDLFITTLANFPYITFLNHDGKDKIFHVTIASKKLRPIYTQVWEYVKEFPFSFQCQFDNIAIYKWGEYKWELIEEFPFKK
ncbi:MAG: 2'-5' RNA ligase family protein [Bacillaceae bacterium]